MDAEGRRGKGLSCAHRWGRIEKQVTLKTTPEHQSPEGEVSGGGLGGERQLDRIQPFNPASREKRTSFLGDRLVSPFAQGFVIDPTDAGHRRERDLVDRFFERAFTGNDAGADARLIPVQPEGVNRSDHSVWNRRVGERCERYAIQFFQTELLRAVADR